MKLLTLLLLLLCFAAGVGAGPTLVNVKAWVSKPPPPDPVVTQALLDCAFIRGRLEELERRTEYHRQRVEALRRFVEDVETTQRRGAQKAQR